MSCDVEYRDKINLVARQESSKCGQQVNLKKIKKLLTRFRQGDKIRKSLECDIQIGL